MVSQQHQRAPKGLLPFPLSKVGSYLIDQLIAIEPLHESYTGLVGLFVLLVSPYVLSLRAAGGRRSTQHNGGVTLHARAMLAVLGDHLLVAANWELPRDAQVHLVVCSRTQRGIEAPDGLQNSPPVHHHCWRPDVAPVQQHEIMIALDMSSVWGRKG